MLYNVFFWTFVLLRFNKNCKRQPNFKCVLSMTSQSLQPAFFLSNRCAFDYFCYWFLLKFLNGTSCLVLVLEIISRVFHLII